MRFSLNYTRWLALAILGLALLFPSTGIARPREWPAWPPNAYDPDWVHRAPRVEAAREGTRATWLAASYEVRLGRGQVELWAEFGGGAGLAYRTPCNPEAGVLLLDHPWRGPHLACFTRDGSLKMIYPVDYYRFGESVLAKQIGSDCGLAGVVGRGGPVLTFWRGGTRYFAEYYGAGYHLTPFQQVVGAEDGWYFAADGEGDAVFVTADGRRLLAQQYREGGGWQSTEIGKLARGGGWQAEQGAVGEVLVEYVGRHGPAQWGSHRAPVSWQWWE
jgi:hypothetical protein